MLIGLRTPGNDALAIGYVQQFHLVVAVQIGKHRSASSLDLARCDPLRYQAAACVEDVHAFLPDGEQSFAIGQRYDFLDTLH